MATLPNRRQGDRTHNALVSIAIALMLWTIQEMFTLGTDLAGFEQRIDALEITSASRYGLRDAQRDHAELDRRIARLETRAGIGGGK